MTRFRILFVFDALVALVVLQQFLALLTDRHGTVSLTGLVLVILATCIGSLCWAATLQQKGRPGLASLVLLIPAIPTLVALLLLGAVILAFSMGGAHH